MLSREQAAQPPLVAGTQQAGPAMTVELLRWLRAGFQTIAADKRKPRSVRYINRALSALWWPLWPLLYVFQRRSLSRRHTRYYLSGDHTAILAITARKNAWHIDDHISCQVGGGHGEALRAVLIPALSHHADRAGVAITATAASRTLAEKYSKDVPGLQDAGAAFPRGRRLRRDPRS